MNEQLTNITPVLILLIRKVGIRLTHGVVPIITLQEEFIPLLVGDDEAHSEQEDDDHFGSAGGHADDSARPVDGRFGGDEAVGTDNVSSGDTDEDG